MANTNMVAIAVTRPMPSVKKPEIASGPKPAARAPSNGTTINGRTGDMRPISSSTTRLQMVNRPIRVNKPLSPLFLVRHAKGACGG